MPDISTLIKKSDYDRRITKVKNNIKKLQTFDSDYFRGKSHFEESGAQNYLVFIPISRYFRLIPNKKHISPWKSKGYLMKLLHLMLLLIIVLLHGLTIMAPK